MRPWAGHEGRQGALHRGSRGAAGTGIDSQYPPPPRGPRTQRCLHTPPAATVARRPPKWASPLRDGRVPLPPFHPIGRLPEPMGGSGGRHFGPKLTSGGALGAAMSVGDMTAPRVASDPASRWVRWRLQSSRGPGGTRTLRLRPGGRGNRPCSKGALRAPWPPVGGSQDSMFGASFPFSGPGVLFVGSCRPEVG